MNIISVFFVQWKPNGSVVVLDPTDFIEWGKNSYIDQNIICCVPTGKKYGTTRGCINNDCFKRFYLFIFNVEDPGQEFVIINQYYFKVIIIIIIIIIIIAYVFRLNKILNRYKILQMQKIYIPL